MLSEQGIESSTVSRTTSSKGKVPARDQHDFDTKQERLEDWAEGGSVSFAYCVAFPLFEDCIIIACLVCSPTVWRCISRSVGRGWLWTVGM